MSDKKQPAATEYRPTAEEALKRILDAWTDENEHTKRALCGTWLGRALQSAQYYGYQKTPGTVSGGGDA